MKQESESYKNLSAYICDTFGIAVPTGLILKQIKDYKDMYSYTYDGIAYTIWYITNIAEKELDVKYGIAYVKYFYEKAEEYYVQQEHLKKYNSEKIKQLNDVSVTPDVVSYTCHPPKKPNLIDLSIICKGGEDC